MSNKREIKRRPEEAIIEQFQKALNSLMGAASRTIGGTHAGDKVYEYLVNAEAWFSRGVALKMMKERGEEVGLSEVEEVKETESKLKYKETESKLEVVK